MKVPHVVRIKTLLVKIIGVVSAVAGGLAVGKVCDTKLILGSDSIICSTRIRVASTVSVP